MKSITFSQALVAIGLVGLTLPLTVGQYSIFHIVAAYTHEGGPSPLAPIVALAATLAFAAVILAAGATRLEAEPDTGEDLTQPQLLVAIGLLGLLIVGALSPMSLIFSILTGWNVASWWTSADAGPLALQLAAFAIPLLVILSNLKSAKHRPSGQHETFPRPFSSLALLTLVIAGAIMPSVVLWPLPYSLFSSRFSVEDLEGSLAVGTAPELVSFGLVAVAIPVAVLVLLRWKEAELTGPSCASLLLITAALLPAVAGHLGMMLLLLFGVPLGALLWPQLRGSTQTNPPDRLNTGQLLAWVALICLAITTMHAYGLALAFTYPESGDAQPLPGPTAALALAYAISLTILLVAVAKLRSETESNPAEAAPSG